MAAKRSCVPLLIWRELKLRATEGGLRGGFEEHGFRAGAEVDGFDAGNREIGALRRKQGAEGVEVVVVFGDDLAETAVGDAVGGLQAFETAEGFAGEGGGARGGNGRSGGGARAGFALELGVGRKRGADPGVGLAEDGGGGLLEVVDAHEQLLALEEEAVDLDLLIGAHQDCERRQRLRGVAHETHERHESRRRLLATG